MNEKYYIGPHGEYELEAVTLELVAIYKNVTVELLKNPETGEISIGWYNQDDTEEIDAEEFYES